MMRILYGAGGMGCSDTSEPVRAQQPCAYRSIMLSRDGGMTSSASPVGLSMTTRFLDAGKSLYAFGDTFLVRCPRCQRCARVARAAPSQLDKPASEQLFDPRRCTCPHCAYVEEWNKDTPAKSGTQESTFQLAMATRVWVSASIVIGGPTDWYFRHPLWLQMPCCGHVLWAYNTAHLAFLREYVQADLRERVPVPNTNNTLASKLPRWMKSAKNRDEVLKGIARLEALLIP